ncbi:PREDICTED: uncharacterized protein LOC108381804, partial [Rhagoletis zephyria]|uniref:uncharacterized protein LOC108381804 n=1 Tax=Rhagoletis zephyria TaxID=28612 RepID=UPI0008118474
MEDECDVNNGQNAFMSKAGWMQKRKEQQNTQTKPNIKCYKCNKYGHYKSQCSFAQKKERTNAFSAVFLSGNYSSKEWYIDSGASMHMTRNKNWLKNVSDKREIEEILIADKSKISVECSGDLQLTTLVNSTEFVIPVTGVLYVPSLATNLLSVSQLIKKGNKVFFEKNYCYIRNQENVIVAKAELEEGIYRVNVKEVGCLLAPISGSVWHRRFGYLNISDLNAMKNGAVIGMSYTDKPQTGKNDCIVCCQGKQTWLPFTHKGNRSQKLLEVIHADICGPME